MSKRPEAKPHEVRALQARVKKLGMLRVAQGAGKRYLDLNKRLTGYMPMWVDYYDLIAGVCLEMEEAKE